MKGGSYTASLAIERMCLAASRARAAPDDVPCTYTVSPARATSASRSSTSRSGAYGLVSLLAPRPRRS